jgi:hypothetical protein
MIDKTCIHLLYFKILHNVNTNLPFKNVPLHPFKNNLKYIRFTLFITI